MRRLLFPLALACALPLAAQAEEPKELNFGLISTDSSVNLKKEWGPLLADMEKRLGIKVNAFFATDYAGVIEAMRFNKVQLAWFGNKSAIEAVDRAGGEVFVQKVRDDGTTGYYSVLITHRDSPYKSLDDVLKNGKQINFGNGDPNSTSGFLVPSYYVFAANKIDARTFFKSSRSASHEANAMAVANKQVDVATCNTEDLEHFKTNSPKEYEQVRVIWKSPQIPSDPIVWRKDLPDSVKAKVREFFLDYGQKGPEVEHDRQVLAALLLTKFQASSDKQLLPVRQLELFRNKTKIQDDTTLSAAEKEAKIREIDAKLAELSQQLAQR
jgi:phosphonate transport system substrate-binding protein